MKQILIIIISTALILTNCSSNATSIDKDSANQTDTLRERFIPILKGVWVLTDYIEKIEKTKSPLQAADKLVDVVSMTIDNPTEKDSLIIGASWNNHEGSSFITYFLPGQNSKSLKTNLSDYNVKTNFYELEYEILAKDTFLLLNLYDATNKLIEKRKYTKVAFRPVGDDLAWGLQKTVNEKLFSDQYIMSDSTGDSQIISFTSEGSITGSSEFTTFYIFTDFIGGPDPSFDEICFNLKSSTPKCFAFKAKMIQSTSTAR